MSIQNNLTEISGSNANVYIEKVVLENFLSFKKDEINFEDSKFIIIVGPNGSGKTSIYQAVRFALGSNDKDMRYNRWSGFIRSGEKRASVELYIKRGNEQIVIKRTVIRGSSPFYQIKYGNDPHYKNIHAHEIQKLIVELNINPDNQFAFVSQGKIDKIKTLKPIELGNFIEEGIGLKGLREEILEQKKKVSNLKNELNSLISKKNGLNIQLDLLRPKLRRLKAKKRLEKIKKKFTDELLWANRDKLIKEIGEIKADIEKIKEIIKEIESEWNENRSKIEEINREISEIEKEINNLSKELGEYQYRKKELVDKINNWQQEKLKFKKDLENLEQIIKEENKEIKNLEGQRENVADEINKIKNKKNLIKEKIKKLEIEKKELYEKIEKNRELLERFNKLNALKEQKSLELSENKKIIEELNKKIDAIFNKLNDIDFKFENNKWFLENPTKDLLIEINKELRHTEKEILENESELERLEEQKRKLIRQIQRLNVSLREKRIILPSSVSILKEEIKKRELKVKGPIIEFLKYDDSLAFAIESVLGEKLLYSFVAADWHTMDLLKRIKDNFNAYCNIYVPKRGQIIPFQKIGGPGVIGYLADLINVIDNDIDIKKVLYSKIKNCIVVKDYHSGKELYKRSNFNGKCVTLKGEQIISYKYAYETPHTKKLKGLLSTGSQQEQLNQFNREYEEVRKRIGELRVKLSKLDELQRDLFNKQNSFANLEFYYKQRERLTHEKNDLYKKVKEIELINKKILTEIERLEERIKEFNKKENTQYLKWNERLHEIPEEIKSNQSEKERWNELLKEYKEDLNKINERLNNQKLSLREKEIEYNLKKEEFQKADKEAFQIFRELSEIENKIVEIEGDIRKKREIIDNQKAERRNYEKIGADISLKLGAERIKLKNALDILNTKENDLKRINKEIGDLISKEKMKIRSIDEIKRDIEKINNELIKYLDVDDSLLVEKEQILESLKRITKNQVDLMKDIDAAKDTENKMENTYFKRFKQVLKQVEEKINNKFSKLEVGIQCSLQLQEDFENLGIIIKASTLEGQKWEVSALSGGQISMISICLILSLNEIKPQPFCMFDEATMFLDEKNSEIVYKLIKTTLEGNSIQFILLLPLSSKILYSLADKLIGVARIGKEQVSKVFIPKIIKKVKR